jgi:Tol biopolymer transport system component
LVRVAGSFPALSPDHRRLALIGDNFTRLDVMNIDGSERKTLYTGKHRGVFSVSWPQPGGEIAFGVGGSFQGPKGEVDLMRVQPDGTSLPPLTEGNGNDAFPSFSPEAPFWRTRPSPNGLRRLE